MVSIPNQYLPYPICTYDHGSATLWNGLVINRLMWYTYCQTSNISTQRITKSPKLKCFTSHLTVFSAQWSQVLSWEWRYSWSSADRRCSSYIWVINNFIAYKGPPYIRDLTVSVVMHLLSIKRADWPKLHGSLRPRQNGHHFTGDIFKCIF